MCYDDVEAKGVMGALFNTKTLAADFDLALGALDNYFFMQPYRPSEANKSLAVGSAFLIISAFKVVKQQAENNAFYLRVGSIR